MAIQNVSKLELEQKLEEILNLLIKKGLMPALSASEKKELTQKISEKLINDPKISLTKDDLKDDAVQKSLGLACMAQLLHTKDPNYSFDYSMLFKSQLEIEQKDLQKEMKLLFTNILKMNPSYQNKAREEQKMMEADINQFAEKMSQQMQEKNELLLKNDKVMNVITAGLDMLSEQRRSLYGVDTHTPGAIFKPVLAVPFGEQMGLQDLATSGESFMGKRDEPNPNIPDPLGLHMAAIINYIADGQTSKAEVEFMKIMSPESAASPSTPNPFSTKPSPFNQ